MRPWRYERRHEPLLGRRAYLMRLAAHGGAGVAIALPALAIGVVGYRYTEGMTWLDSFVNASMILSGMGPAGALSTSGGKLFAGLYALFSGVVFLVVVGVFLAPVIHRFLHRFHLEIEE
ncbi:MAG: hypothetical protein ACE15D_10970 [Candidatus Eisenbacteria bacterium]|nr:hypothetical protein [Candidatus Eisenbacteria bacterium]